MMIVPINADINEAQNVTQKDRQQRLERSRFGAVGDFQLQHHDRDNDRQHSVAERFQTILFHGRNSEIHFGSTACEEEECADEVAGSVISSNVVPEKSSW